MSKKNKSKENAKSDNEIHIDMVPVCAYEYDDASPTPKSDLQIIAGLVERDGFGIDVGDNSYMVTARITGLIDFNEKTSSLVNR